MVILDPNLMVTDLKQRAQKLLNAAEAIKEAYGKPKGTFPGERRQQLIKFLNDHGPKRRSEIKISSGIPAGTISHLLKEGGAFERLEDWRWRVRDNVLGALETDKTGETEKMVKLSSPHPNP